MSRQPKGLPATGGAKGDQGWTPNFGVHTLVCLYFKQIAALAA